ncbi:MAG: transposase [Boseongicola sp. SB0673_bin_14]|nr:transposase [Boseongicola sp. SB0667_bin_21]MYI68774.1 transposase [Boseongicola sp. SB0673_bin_14]
MRARAKKVSASRRKRANALRREWDRTRMRERNALHRISADFVKRHSRIAIEALQGSNMRRNPNLARSIAERRWRRLAEQLTCTAESAGGEVVRVSARRTSTDCHACGHRRFMASGARAAACGGCGLVTDRDVNAARNILQRGIALARRDIGSSSRPGASESVLESHVAGSPRQDTERCTAERIPSRTYAQLYRTANRRLTKCPEVPAGSGSQPGKRTLQSRWSA